MKTLLSLFIFRITKVLGFVWSVQLLLFNSLHYSCKKMKIKHHSLFFPLLNLHILLAWFENVGKLSIGLA